jgi:3-hydroxybutyryl-CoA dehydrogenase
LDKISENLDVGVSKGKVSQQIKESTLKSIAVTHEIMNVTGELIIEAVVEDLQIKTDLFLKLEAINGDHTIFASNTSSIPITRIGSQLKNPEHLAGLHFFNPVHIMKLVEVISGCETKPEVIKVLTLFSKKIGKVPVTVADSPGFIVNRVARHYYVESLKILEEQVADHETIDDLLENFGFKMGPFRLMDLIGVDTNLAVTRSIYESFHFDPKFAPSRIQQQKVEAGHHGRKTGKGFYEY